MHWPSATRRRSRRELGSDGAVLVGLVAFVVGVYGVIVLGGGALVFGSTSPRLGLSVLATAVVALAFDPVQVGLEKVAARTVYGGRLSPYEALRRFSAPVTGSEAAEDLPARMAQVLGEGTGAEWTQVWLVVDEHPVPAATWPADSDSDSDPPSDPRTVDTPGRRWLPVSHDDEILGLLVVQECRNIALTSVEERLFAQLARQAGLALRGTRLRAELEQRLGDLSVRARELHSSRQRLVDVQDEERRLRERDIHDGAQQHLVALAVNLRLVQTLAARSPQRAATLLAAQQQAAADAIATLVHLSEGIYPPLLAQAGLVAALEAVAAISPVAVRVTADGVGRYPADIEAAVYFCCLEALQNAVKHSGAELISLTLTGEPGALLLAVEDDGAGFDPHLPAAGNGLANMRDRIESVSGTLTLRSDPHAGTSIGAWVPVRSQVASGPDREA